MKNKSVYTVVYVRCVYTLIQRFSTSRLRPDIESQVCFDRVTDCRKNNIASDHKPLLILDSKKMLLNFKREKMFFKRLLAHVKGRASNSGTLYFVAGCRIRN